MLFRSLPDDVLDYIWRMVEEERRSALNAQVRGYGPSDDEDLPDLLYLGAVRFSDSEAEGGFSQRVKEALHRDMHRP